jgi:hypothetical protein
MARSGATELGVIEVLESMVRGSVGFHVECGPDPVSFLVLHDVGQLFGGVLLTHCGISDP